MFPADGAPLEIMRMDPAVRHEACQVLADTVRRLMGETVVFVRLFSQLEAHAAKDSEWLLLHRDAIKPAVRVLRQFYPAR